MEIIFTIGKRTIVKKTCSVFCHLEMLEDFPDLEPELVRIINHSTLNSEMPLWINLERAWFVLCSDGDEEAANAPYAFAYQTKQQAEEAAGNENSEVLEWSELDEIVRELTDEYEPKKPSYRYNSNKRRKR